MISVIGYGAIAVALALAVYGTIAGYYGIRRDRAELVKSAEAATFMIFGLVTIANVAMIYALVTHDFSVSYVAQVGSRSTPLLFTVISLWGALEGSILFWAWVLASYTAAVVFLHRHKGGKLIPAAMCAMLAVGTFFYILLVGPANPFGQVFPVPADGPGPNPLLQNHILMAIHPPLLYLGYVGMTVPFGFAIGALVSRRLDTEWITLTRRWTLAAWTFLTLAIVAGMWWSYEVLGWGGYWAWDPVENASFMPWLTATAFLHSVMVEERRGLLKVWNLSLIVATFLLTILGTFLTRSGIISSVHAFAQGSIGYYFLGFIAITLLASLALLAGRSDSLESTGRLESAASRETVFLLNNLLLTAFTFTVVLGTIFPLVAEAARGVKVSVGEPFFNKMTLPLAMGLIFLMGVGPALPWGRVDRDRLNKFFVPAGLAVLTALVAVTLGLRGIYGILAFSFGAFALSVNLGEFVRGATKRVRAHGENPVTALGRLVRANQRRYGGYTAHIGVILLVVGIAASSVFRIDEEATLRPGATMTVEDYTLRFDELWAREEPQRFVVGADLSVIIDGETVGALDPRLNFYPTQSQPIATPAVRSRPDEDLYVNLMAFERDGSSVTVRVLVEPLVMWIWIGGGVIALGALIALLDPKRKRRPTPRRAPVTSAEPPTVETV